MKTRTVVFLLLLLFISINITVYIFTKISIEHKIDLVLKNNLNNLNTHYKLLLETQRTTAQAIYQTTIQKDKLIKIISQANNATQEKKKKLREELHKLVEPFYTIIKLRGVLQYHFTLQDNESFYRAHKPGEFGDNLTDVRMDFKYVNEMKKPIRGFGQGRTAHGFRNTFPLFDKKNKHIGAIEISFSSDSFQWYLNNISNIHTHFLVNKNVFNAKAWKKDDLVLKYDECAETKDYMITLNTIHTKEACIDENKIKLEPVREKINSNILLGRSFSLYIEQKNHVVVVSFLPIKSLEDENAAWMVSYEKSPIIYSSFINGIIIKIITFLLSLLTVFFLYKQMLSKQKIQSQKKDIERQHKLLDDILNSIDNIIFITDFKNVKFSNNKFKDMLNVKHISLFNIKTNYNLLSIFLTIEGRLHQGLIKDNMDFVSLIATTPIKDRIVSIEDKNFNQITFKISIFRLENKLDYLVTLSDITKMQEDKVETEKKAYIDGLTHVYNRNKFDEILKEELYDAKRYNTIFSIAIIDIDKFKDFNDTYGHLIGDEVLVKMASSVNEHVRDTDLFARWGGEEFVILFKNTSLKNAAMIANKLKNLIEQNEHATAGKITASFGITEYVSGDTEESIFKRCDEALYLAKERGRNRIETL